MGGRGYQTTSFGPPVTPKVIKSLMIANAVVFVGLLKAGVLLSGSFTELWADIEKMATGAILPFLVSILNGQVHSDNKMRLVSLRWKHPRPIMHVGMVKNMAIGVFVVSSSKRVNPQGFSCERP